MHEAFICTVKYVVFKACFALTGGNLKSYVHIYSPFPFRVSPFLFGLRRILNFCCRLVSFVFLFSTVDLAFTILPQDFNNLLLKICAVFVNTRRLGA